MATLIDWGTTVRVALLALGFTLGCGSTPPDDSAPVPRGDRLFGVHVTQAAAEDYGKAYLAARATGMNLMPFSFSWTQIETATGWDVSVLDIANAFFGPQGLPLYLTLLSPINTNVAEVPGRFRATAYDDPALIAGFNRLLDTVRAHTPGLTLRVLIIGNEIDATLGSDPAAWARYRTFFQQTRDHARQLWGPSLEVGTTITLPGLYASPSQGVDQLIAASDLASVTYYPIREDFSVRAPGVAQADFDQLVARVIAKPIYLQEVGYPTSTAAGSTEEMQREFALEVFRAWDVHASRIRYVGWLWLTDLSQTQTDGLLRYYGLPVGPATLKFGEYLRTLGLRQHGGTAKSALRGITESLRARGW